MADQLKPECPEPALQVDADMLILDYLVHIALQAVLQDHRRQLTGTLEFDAVETSGTEALLRNVDDFLTVFIANHPDAAVPESVHFRLRLLKFATSFCRRVFKSPTTPDAGSIQSMRRNNQKRAKHWHHASSRVHGLFPDVLRNSSNVFYDPDDLRYCQSHFLYAVISHDNKANGDFYESKSSVSLLDLLPEFMALTAMRAYLNSDWTITWRWMDLACEMMLQAVLEQYLVYGAKDKEVAEEAFAWGFLDSNVAADRVDDEGGQDALLVNALFRAQDDDADEADDKMDTDDAQEGRPAREVEDWKGVRDEWLEKLKSRTDEQSLLDHLMQVSEEHKIHNFEAKLLDFLSAMLKSTSSPILVQLEQGKLEGLSCSETQALKTKVGWNRYL